MALDLIIENLRNPALLFFILGLLAVRLKSSLTIPETSSRFISMYLLFAIGFKGGQELSESEFNSEMFGIMALGLLSAAIIPALVFPLLRKKYDHSTAAAVSAAYGSVSAVTFVTAIAFLEMQGIAFGGHMVALMAMMEAPAIVVGLLLARSAISQGKTSMTHVLVHSLTNGSVFLLIGSTIIGFLTSADHAHSIEAFTTDIFKGFLVIFLLDMGIQSGRQLKGLFGQGLFSFLFAILFPLIIGSVVAWCSGFLTDEVGDRLLLTVLTASASYIAVPAAMKIALPEANPGIYTPMALGITFPVNIVLGIPLYFQIISL